MEPFHDIYRKEESHLFGKRSKRRRTHPKDPSERPPQDAARALSRSTHDQGSRSTSNRADMVSRSSSKRKKHRRHRDSRYDEPPSSRMLWILLALMFIVYAVFLGVSLYRSHRSAAAKKTKAEVEAEETVKDAVAETSEEDSAYVRERIKAWKRIPDVILEAQTFQDKGMPDHAEDRLVRALETMPDVARIKLKLAQTYIDQNKLQEAQDTLLEVLETTPDNSAARLLLVSVYDQRNSYDASLAVADWIMETDPGSVKAHQLAAEAYLETDRPGLAIPHLRKVVSLERDNIIAQNRLGSTYAQIGEYVKAIQIFNDILSRDTTDSMTYYNLAVCYAKQEMAEQSVEILSRAMGLFDDDFVAAWMRNADFDTIRDEAIFDALVAQAEREPRRREKTTPTGN